MLIRPNLKDIKVILYYLGRIIVGLGVFFILPIFVGIIFKETAPLYDFLLSSGLCFILGLILIWIFRIKEETVTWMHGMLIVSLSWLVAMFLGAIPLFLSGHYQGYLDSCFEAMSGLATTGLTLTKDLDHLSFTHNFFRHLLMFMGGQGIVLVFLSFLIKTQMGVFKIYVGEARDEIILPNVVSTARFIWIVSITYLILGTLILALVGIKEGLSIPQAIFNGLCIFMAGFDTGGFSPYSQNILYYHSFLYELITIVIMVLGTINFKLHYSLWSGNRKEIVKNIEIISFFTTVMITFSIVILGIVQKPFSQNFLLYFRQGFYQLFSAHSGTGFSNLYSLQIKRWSNLAILGLIVAMGLGGGVCSTTGGIKALRIGIIFKAIVQDIKRILLPESTVLVEKFHHIKEIILEDKHVRSCMIITFCYLFLYFLGALIAVGLGYPFLDALFESVSASANVGLSLGITQLGMPSILKVTYILQMWIGRLEFIAIFTLIGFLVSIFKGK